MVRRLAGAVRAAADGIADVSDIDFKALYASLRLHEGEPLKVYDDATGKELRPGGILVGNATIGVGRNLTDRGISMDESLLLMENDVTTAIKELDRSSKTKDWWRTKPDCVRRALIEMCYNMGMPRLEKFERMLSALKANDWESAAAEALNSKWAAQVGERARTMAARIREAA